MPVTLCITEKVQVAFVNILVRKDRILQTINFKVILFFFTHGILYILFSKMLQDILWVRIGCKRKSLFAPPVRKKD